MLTSEKTVFNIYADDGISGTNTKNREEFNRMIEECEAIIPKDIFLRVQEELVRRQVVRTSDNGKKHSYSCNRRSLRSSGMPRKPLLTVLMNSFWSSRRSFLKRLTTRKPTMRLPTKFSSSANSAGSVLLTLLPEMHKLQESTTCRITSRSSVPTLLNSMKP